MKNTLAIAILAVTSLFAAGQTTDAHQYTTFIPTYPAPAPNAHELAMRTIKEYETYMKSKGWGSSDIYSYVVIAGDPASEQRVAVTNEGKVEVRNISMEDAILLLASDKLRDSLAQFREYDAERKAANDAPPPVVKYGGKTWTVKNTDDWSGGKALGTTWCRLRKVNILKTNPDKRATVMHEMMHVATGCSDDPGLHALIIEAAPGLVKLLRENPDLVKWLTAKETKR